MRLLIYGIFIFYSFASFGGGPTDKTVFKCFDADLNSKYPLEITIIRQPSTNPYDPWDTALMWIYNVNLQSKKKDQVAIANVRWFRRAEWDGERTTAFDYDENFELIRDDSGKFLFSGVAHNPALAPDQASYPLWKLTYWPLECKYVE